MYLTERQFRNYYRKVDNEGGEGCWPWMAYCTRDGHGRFWLNNKLVGAHQIAYCLANGMEIADIPKGLQINHLCHFAPCQNPNHLYMGTQAENVQDIVRAGNHVSAKLSDDNTMEIRRLYASGDYTQQQIGDRFGVSQAHISYIVRHTGGNKSEKHSRVKLSDDHVLEIRRLYATGGHTYRGLADRFGVVPGHVGRIVNRNQRTNV